MLSVQAVGYIGIGLYSVVFLFAICRVYLHFIPYRRPWYSTRKVFHIFLAVYALLQTLSFVAFARGSENYSKWCYSCHLYGIFFEIATFSVVAILWSKTLLSRNNARRRIIPFFVVMDGAFLIYTTLIVIQIQTTDKNFVDWATSSQLYLYLLIIEPILLAINGGCMVYLGVRISQRLVAHPSWNQLPANKQRIILSRLWLTMIVCCGCFCMRAFLLLWDYFQGAENFSMDIWWIFSTWIPTVMPATVLLYTMRRTDANAKGVFTKGVLWGDKEVDGPNTGPPCSWISVSSDDGDHSSRSNSDDTLLSISLYEDGLVEGGVIGQTEGVGLLKDTDDDTSVDTYSTIHSNNTHNTQKSTKSHKSHRPNRYSSQGQSNGQSNTSQPAHTDHTHSNGNGSAANANSSQQNLPWSNNGAAMLIPSFTQYTNKSSDGPVCASQGQGAHVHHTPASSFNENSARFISVDSDGSLDFFQGAPAPV